MNDMVTRLSRNRKHREQCLKERDELICEAKKSGLPVTAIARHSGLSRQQIHRILRPLHPDRS